jgi:hypothetical protein
MLLHLATLQQAQFAPEFPLMDLDHLNLWL